jgi:signal transduction histidine kinase
MPSVSWSLRVRVAIAFLLTTALAMLAIGLFVQWRVQDTLEEGLRDQLETEMHRLVAVPPNERAQAVERLAGEIHGQLLSGGGTVVASSPGIRGRVVDPAAADHRFAEGPVAVADDHDDASDRNGEAADSSTEDEFSIILVRAIGDQVLAISIGREDADDAARAVRTQLLLSGPVALVLAGGLGYVVAGIGLRPIERMRARAATISSRSAGERLPVPSTVELRRLALTLNAMLGRLDEGLDRERRFAADASHELRTPLTLLLTEVELALASPRTHDELLVALHSAEQEVRRLIALSENLLLLAGADAGHLQVNTQAVDLAELAADVVRRFSSLADAATRSVSTSGDREVLLSGDPDQLRRVVSNLVDNALRHGAGDVEVRVLGGIQAVLEVSDAGPGFVEERPFERFAASHGSVGLGLSIVEEIVRAHGGEIGISRQLERTVVRVTLPI